MKDNTTLTIKDYLKAMGPGAIMAASILGPGSVTTASVQGADYGYTSLWILLLACVIAFFYQEPAIRIAIGCKKTVLQGVREYINPQTAWFLWFIIFVGCIAYQAGNLGGASMALVYFFPETSSFFWSVLMNFCALAIVLCNQYKLIEKANHLLILMMVFAFVLTSCTSGPSVGDLVQEGFSFQIPGNNALLAISLLATTAVPHLILGYSTFLSKKYPESQQPMKDIRLSRFDLAFNMFITFLISSSIIVCAATLIHPTGIKITSAADMAVQLEPLLGRFAGIFFSLGLWAASISSVLYHVSVHNMLFAQAFSLEDSLNTKHSKFIVAVVVAVPILIIYFFQSSPVQLIIMAQAFNGIALPMACIICWILLNKKELMGEYTNTKKQNIIMATITAITCVFALNALFSASKSFFALFS